MRQNKGTKSRTVSDVATNNVTLLRRAAILSVFGKAHPPTTDGKNDPETQPLLSGTPSHNRYGSL